MSPDIAASVKARLLNRARAAGDDFQLILTRYAAERFLYRLGASTARGRCVLKGASLLSVWLDEPHRATRDIDLLASGPKDEESIRSLLDEICSVACENDGVVFDLSGLRIDPIRAEEEYSGNRARFQAIIGKSRIPVQIDIGVGDALTTPPAEVDYPCLLDTTPAPRIRAYPREASVAEKFEAMIKLDIRNSRMKDFHDLWLLPREFPFGGATLQQAVQACFERRGTPWTREIPRPLTTAFYQLPDLQQGWQGYRQESTIRSRPPADFLEIGETIIRFLTPVRESIVTSRPFALNWPAGGPWSPASILETR